MEELAIRHNRLRIYSSVEELDHAAAQLFVSTAQEVLQSADRFSVVLSGGSTPEPVYKLLAQEPYRNEVDWSRTHVFWGDERCVPRNDARNNARMARNSLLDRVPIPADQVHPMPSEEEPGQAAVHYETTIRAFFQNAPARFDLVLLGLGENGHTASLFPHTAILDESERWVKDVYVPDQDMYRVSLTVPILNQAGQVVFLAHGTGKAVVLKDVLLGAPQPRDLPAQLIHPTNGETTWLLDRDAAAQLPR